MRSFAGLYTSWPASTSSLSYPLRWLWPGKQLHFNIMSKNICRYDAAKAASSIAGIMAFGNFISAFVTNLPFVVSPTVALSLYIINYLKINEGTVHDANVATIWVGVLLCIFGTKPVAILFLKLIPHPLQAATAVGIGLLTSLSGAVEIGLIVKGERTLLGLGDFTPSVIIGLVTVMLIGVCFYYRVKGAMVLGLIFGSIVQWATANSWPKSIGSIPETLKEYDIFDFNVVSVPLIFSTFVICFSILVGITRAFSDIAHLTHDNGHIPRGRLLFIVCGIISIVSGLNGGHPYTLSNETPVALKDGAKTGLSVLVSSFLFFILIFISPLFSEIPTAGTMPIIFMIGVFLIANAKKIEWTHMADALPSYFIIFMMPFSQSLLYGFIFGFVTYIVMTIVSGEFRVNAINYFEAVREEFKILFRCCSRNQTVEDRSMDIVLPNDLSIADITTETIVD